jgi:hypothetical protein
MVEEVVGHRLVTSVRLDDDDELFTDSFAKLEEVGLAPESGKNAAIL